MTDPAPTHRAFPADGFSAGWSTAVGGHEQRLTLRWENEAWTASGHVERENVEFVIRLSPLWHVRQFLLFRDLAEPDLWLGTDGHGRWGEVNGAHRTDLDGPLDVALACTPFTHALPIRRLPLAVGDAAEISVLDVDVETLGVVPASVVYERVAARRWRVTRPGAGPRDRAGPAGTEFEVDEYGVPLDVPETFHRV